MRIENTEEIQYHQLNRSFLQKTKICGSALITVLLVILIFFIISIVISTIVTQQARRNLEIRLADLSYYVADAGIRYATPKVMYRFLFREGYETGLEKVQDTMILDAEYQGKLTVDIYALEELDPDEDGYTNKNRLACLGQIYRLSDNVVVAQRTICAELYLGRYWEYWRPPNTYPIPPASGNIKAVFSKYYEKNR